MTLFTVAGFSACTFGCLCIYLASAHQRLLAAAWPARPARAAGAALLLLAWLALVQDLQRLTAAFALATAVMLALVLLPYAAALHAMCRARQA